MNDEDFDRVVNTTPLNGLAGDLVHGMSRTTSRRGDARAGLQQRSSCFLLGARPARAPAAVLGLPPPSHHRGRSTASPTCPTTPPATRRRERPRFLLRGDQFQGGTNSGPGHPSSRKTCYAGVEYGGFAQAQTSSCSPTARTSVATPTSSTITNWRRAANISLAWCEENGLSSPLGRFGHYDYFNSDQCVIASRGLAEELLERARIG